MSSNYTRDLGITEAVADVLNPTIWREDYAWPLVKALYGAALQEATRAAQKQARLLLLQQGGALPCIDPALEAGKAVADADRAVEILTDTAIRRQLRAAFSELEMKLGTPLGIEVVKSPPVDEGLVRGADYDRLQPRLPYNRQQVRDRSFLLQLEPGVISIERLRVYIHGEQVWEVSPDAGNEDMLHLEHPRQGSLHIVSGANTVPVFSTGANLALWHAMYAWGTNVPNVWAVDYTVGSVAKGKPGHIEAALAHWVRCVASITLLAQASQYQSQGVTNSSTSISGLSRSVSLQSGIYGLNTALATAYKEASERLNWEDLRVQKRGISVMAYSG